MGFRHTFVLIPAACLVVAGCSVLPGEMETSAITRYQQAIARRASQRQGSDSQSDLLRPPTVCFAPRLDVEEVVERTIRTTRKYEGKIDPDGQLPRDRSRTTVVVTELDLDARSGRPDPKTARIVRRFEIEATRTFRLREGPQETAGRARQVLLKTVEKETQFVRDPNCGELVRRAEIVTTSTYREVSGKAADGEEERHVEVKTSTGTTRFPPAGKGAGAKALKPIKEPEVHTASRMSVGQYRLLAGPSRDSTTSRTIRTGRKRGDPAMLKPTRRLVRLSLQDAVLAALATNPDIRVVSFDPAISREEMAMAAAVFDHAVFFDMNFKKVEGEADDPLGLYDNVQRARSWSAGVRQLAVTGASWTLRAALSRNWDSSVMDGLYKSVAALEVTQPLLRGAWPAYNLANVRIARLNSKVSDAWFRAEVERVVTEVTVAYWELVQARRTMLIRQRLLERTRQALEDLKARRRIDVPAARIRQAEVALRQRDAGLIDMRQVIGEVQNRLIHLVPDPQLKAPPACEVVPVTAPLERKLQVNAGEQLMTAVRHNPLLEQTRLGIAAAKIGISVAENETLPILNLFAAVESQDFRRSLMKRGADYTSGDCILGYQFDLLLDYPIGNRWAMARLRQAKFQHAQTIAAMQQTVNNLALEISEGIRRIRQAQERIEAQKVVAESAEAHIEALRDVEQIRGGVTAGFLRVKLRAQEDLAEAEEELQQAIFDYNSARAELNQTTGTALELHRIEIALPALVGGARPGAAAPPPPATRPTKRPPRRDGR